MCGLGPASRVNKILKYEHWNYPIITIIPKEYAYQFWVARFLTSGLTLTPTLTGTLTLTLTPTLTPTPTLTLTLTLTLTPTLTPTLTLTLTLTQVTLYSLVSSPRPPILSSNG